MSQTIIQVTRVAPVAIDSLVHVARPSAGDPAGALVLLHGRGTSEQDLLPLVDVLDPEQRLLAVAPRAPLTLPPGGHHWYVSVGIPRPDPATFHAAMEVVPAWLDALLEENGLDHERLVLGGFSQGTVMSYAIGLGAGRPRPRGLIALSGFMPEAPDFELDLTGLDGYPAALGHGSYDPVIGVEWGRAARDRLVEAGAAVTWRESPMPHSVDPDYLRELADWVARLLPG
ncbi:MAG: phospholipase/carboxylesterase [Thermoleophilaceae bacterium]|nr:phospholipase/carboxylesterase [Thermoleophilaceae bacterium]